MVVSLGYHFADYFEEASEADLGRLLIKAVPTDNARVTRNRTYNKLLEGLTDDEIDDFQNFYKDISPEYFNKFVPAEGQYGIMIAVANDLGRNKKYLVVWSNRLHEFLSYKSII